MADPTVETVNPLELNEDSTGAVIETVAEKADRLITEHGIDEPLHDATYTLVEHGNFDLEQLNDTDMITTLEAFDRFQDWAQSGPLGMEQGTILSEAVARATVEPELMDDFIDDLLDDNTFNDPSMLERLFSDDTQLTQFITSQMAAAGAGGNFQNAFSHGDDDSTRLSGGRRKAGLDSASMNLLLDDMDVSAMQARLGDIGRRLAEIEQEVAQIDQTIANNEAQILHIQTSILPGLEEQIAAEETTHAELQAELTAVETFINQVETESEAAMNQVNADMAEFVQINLDLNNDGLNVTHIVYRDDSGELYILSEDDQSPVYIRDIPDNDRLLQTITRQEGNGEITGDQNSARADQFHSNFMTMHRPWSDELTPYYQSRMELTQELSLSEDRIAELTRQRDAAVELQGQLARENEALIAQRANLIGESEELQAERDQLTAQIEAREALQANLTEQQTLQNEALQIAADIAALDPDASNEEYTRLTERLEAVEESMQALATLQGQQETLQQQLADLENQRDEAVADRDELISEYEAMANSLEDPELQAVALERLETGQFSCSAPYISMVDPNDPRFNDADRAYINHHQDFTAFLSGEEPPGTEGLSDELRNIIRMDEIGAQFEEGGWAVAEQNTKIDNISDEISDAKIRLANLNAETNERVSTDDANADAETDNTENLTAEYDFDADTAGKLAATVNGPISMDEIASIAEHGGVPLETLIRKIEERAAEVNPTLAENDPNRIEITEPTPDEPAPEEELVASADTVKPSDNDPNYNQTISAPGVSV